MGIVSESRQKYNLKKYLKNVKKKKLKVVFPIQMLSIFFDIEEKPVM